MYQKLQKRNKHLTRNVLSLLKSFKMKKVIIYIIFVLFTVGSVNAQVDRTKYPEPGVAPTLNIGNAETFTLPNGLKVYVVENHKLPRITFSLILDRDPILEGDKAGLTSMVGELMRSGTTLHTKEQLDEAIDQIGASISVSSTSATASSLSKYKTELLNLFSEILFQPSFPAVELDKIKKQFISGLASQKDDPKSISNVISNAVLYGKNHPYGERETEVTIGNVEVVDIQNYYNTYFKPNIGYLAIVGDITKKEAEKLVKQHFGNWKKGKVPTHSWPAVKGPEENQVILVDRPSSVQSVINVTYPVALEPNSSERISSSLLSYILGGGSSSRLFMNLRENKGYTYGAYSSLSPDKLIGSFSANASVRTEVTDSSVYQMLYELKHLLDENTITEEELVAAKAYLTGSFGRSLESPSTIASFALNSEIQKLPKDYYKNYLKNLDAVTVRELNKLAPKYIKPSNAYVVIVGNAAEFKEKLGEFGKVTHYTAEGDVEVKKEADASVSAGAVIEKYLLAIGGKEKVSSINTLRQEAEAEVQGMKISQVIQVDKKQGKALHLTLMGPQELSRLTITRDKVTATSMGAEQDLPAAAGNALKAMLDIVPELNYASNGTMLSLDGISDVNGEDAYKVIMEKGDVKNTDYFSVATGLKLKSESPINGEATYSDYKQFDGVKFPTVITVNNPQMPVTLKMVIVKNEINPTLTEADWK